MAVDGREWPDVFHLDRLPWDVPWALLRAPWTLELRGDGR